MPSKEFIQYTASGYHQHVEKVKALWPAAKRALAPGKSTAEAQRTRRRLKLKNVLPKRSRAIPQSLNPSIPQSLSPSIPQSLNPSCYSYHLYAAADPVRRQVNPAAVAAGLDLLFEHLFAEDLEFNLTAGGSRLVPRRRIGIGRLHHGSFHFGFKLILTKYIIAVL